MSSEAHSRIGPGIGVVLLLFNLTMASRTLAENSQGMAMEPPDHERPFAVFGIG
jgi:hypothetical protein